jgi:hypothetical protein
MRLANLILCAAIAMVFGIVPGHADKRVALVIGNAAYRNIPVLRNPKNDAARVGAKLRDELGFETIVETLLTPD